MKLFNRANIKVIFINLIFLLIFPWFLEFTLNLKNYNGNTADKKKLQKVIYKQNIILQNENTEVKKLIDKNILPTFYPGTGLKINEFEDMSKKLKFYPLGSQPDKNLYLCDEGYGLVTYKSDHLGFRNKSEVWEKYPYNLLIFGDSYVHGSCVNDENTISGHLNTLNVENINLGLGDNQPLIYGSGIIQFSEPIPPKNIVLIFSLHNDLMGNDPRYEGYKLKKNIFNYKFSNEEKKHVLSKEGIKYFEYINYEIKKRLNENKKKSTSDQSKNTKKLDLFSFLKLNKFRLLLKDELGILIMRGIVCYKEFCFYGSINKKIQKDIENAIYDSKILTKKCNLKNNCKPIIILISHSKYWDNDYLYDLRKKEFISQISQLKSNYNSLTFLDSSTFVDPKDLNNYAPAGGHLSNEGYKKIALEIKKHIK